MFVKRHFSYQRDIIIPSVCVYNATYDAFRPLLCQGQGVVNFIRDFPHGDRIHAETC
jgi:hypothetical protein